MKCNQCGHENEDSANNCVNCGYTFTDDPPVRPEADIYPKPEFPTFLKRAPNSLVQILYIAAISAFIIGIITAIYALCQDDDYESSTTNQALSFVAPFRYGAFTSGLLLGFALLVTTLKGSSNEVMMRATKFLYIQSILVFVLGTAVAALQVAVYNSAFHGHYDNYFLTSSFLGEFISNGFVAGAILFGLAAITSRREGFYDFKSVHKAFYIMAIILFLISIVATGLTSFKVAEYDSFADSIMFFILLLVVNGFLYGGILAGFGGVLASCKPTTQYFCSNCDHDVLDEWKLCPYCGERLDES